MYTYFLGRLGRNEHMDHCGFICTCNGRWSGWTGSRSARKATKRKNLCIDFPAAMFQVLSGRFGRSSGPTYLQSPPRTISCEPSLASHITIEIVHTILTLIVISKWESKYVHSRLADLSWMKTAISHKNNECLKVPTLFFTL